MQWKSAMEDDVPMKLNYMTLTGFRSGTEGSPDFHAMHAHFHRTLPSYMHTHSLHSSILHAHFQTEQRNPQLVESAMEVRVRWNGAMEVCACRMEEYSGSAHA